MDEYINKSENSVPFINARERFLIPKKKELIPKIDGAVSKAIGFNVYARDPRLLKLIVKWKKGKPQDSMESDNFLQNPEKIKELREVLSK